MPKSNFLEYKWAKIDFKTPNYVRPMEILEVVASLQIVARSRVDRKTNNRILTNNSVRLQGIILCFSVVIRHLQQILYAKYLCSRAHSAKRARR